MTFEYPEINKNKEINSKLGDGPFTKDSLDWKNPTCNSNEVTSPSSETKALSSKQSPININTEAVHECHLLCKLDLNYKPSKCNVERTEQGIIKFNWDSGSSIDYNNNTYELKHIQIHTPSLHHIDNKSSEMEINLYHYNHANMEEVYQENRHTGEEGTTKKSDMEKIKDKHLPDVLKDEHPHTDTHPENKGFKSERGVIISILVNNSSTSSKNGETMASRPNMFISQFIHNQKFLDLKKKSKGEHETRDIEVHEDWNVTDLLPKSKAYYTYEGSIPFPPCVENFKWVVFEQHIDVIEEFINILRSEGNPQGFRNLHPLNNRVVYYNNNIEVKSSEAEGEKGTNKHDEVKKILAPIRIKVDNRTGYEYRQRAKDIIASYTSGSKSNYMNDDTVLISINKSWDDVGKIGYEEVFLPDILNNYMDDADTLTSEGKHFTKYIVFDSASYDGDYFIKTLPLLDLTLEPNGKEIIIDADTSTKVNIIEIVKEMNKLFAEIGYKDFYDATTSKFNIETYKTNLKTKIKADTKNVNLNKLLAPASAIDDNQLLILYTLLEADLNFNPSQQRNHLKIINSSDLAEFEYEFWNIYFKEMHAKVSADAAKKEKMKDIIFKSRSDDLNTTINNYGCQKWGSNSVHHEGSIWNAFSPKIHLKEEGYTLNEIDELPPREKHRIKRAIRDGLLDYINDERGKRFVPNNKCRNPNGSASAAWCYTTNPKVRWDYCMKPDISFKTRKLLLVVIFLFIIYLAYFTVKLIFQYNMFNKFMAMLTGAQLPKDVAFKANQVAGTIRNNLQGIK